MFMVKQFTLFFKGDSSEKPLLPIYAPSNESNDGEQIEQNKTLDPLLKLNRTVKTYLGLTVATLKKNQEHDKATFFREPSQLFADEKLIKQAKNLVNELYPNPLTPNDIAICSTYLTFLTHLETSGVNADSHKQLVELINKLNKTQEIRMNVSIINELTCAPKISQNMA